MEKNEFLEKLLCHILEGIYIPKVQVERAISPIMGMFIEGIVNKYFENHDEYSGQYLLISPEFPLKKDVIQSSKKESHQSNNIDFLLVNKEKRVLVFFELKTDKHSKKDKQLKIYIGFKNRITKNTCKILRDDLVSIDKASKSHKYEYVISKFDSVIGSASDITNCIIIYLVPSAIINSIQSNPEVNFVLSYNDLPDNIVHPFASEWSIIRKNFLILDSHSLATCSNIIYSGDPLVTIVSNIKRYVSQLNILPQYFQLGNTGESRKPNYQITFEDNSVKTFHFSGKPHSVVRFKPENLGKKYIWREFATGNDN